jgi:hypothetical protein
MDRLIDNSNGFKMNKATPRNKDWTNLSALIGLKKVSTWGTILVENLSFKFVLINSEPTSCATTLARSW